MRTSLMHHNSQLMDVMSLLNAITGCEIHFNVAI